MTEYQVMNTYDLTEIIKEGWQLDFNRQVAQELIDVLDPNGTHIVVFSMVHNDREMRVAMLCKVKGTMVPTMVWLDMTFARFNRLNKVSSSE